MLMILLLEKVTEMYSEWQNLLCFKAYDIRGRAWSRHRRTNCSLASGVRSLSISAHKRLSLLAGTRVTPLLNLQTPYRVALWTPGAMSWILECTGTEEMYWGVTEFKADAGIIVTASHNPINYNGMKIVKVRLKAS